MTRSPRGRTSATRRSAELLIALLIACFPLAWLALFDKAFHLDWNRHLWMIAYTGEYFRHHLSFPLTFNTDAVVGIPFPLFYGTLFYPLAGMVSAVTGAAIALRVVVVALFWLQSFQVARLVRAVYPGRFVAWGVSALVSWAVYPLTNLYNRNAITELVAVLLLVSACSVWLRVVVCARDDSNAWVSTSFAWILLALSAGSHPITGVLGGALFLVLLAGGLFASTNRGPLVRVFAVNALLFVAVLAPWVYVTLKFQKDLLIGWSLKAVLMFPESIDAWWTRILPIPFDIRPLRAELLRTVSTPYLDAQINFGLLVVVGFLAFHAARRLRRKRIRLTAELRVAAACLVLFALIYYCSISVALWGLLPASFAFLQFPYRLVTYCDIFLFLAALFLLRALRSFEEELRIPLGVCLAVAVTVMAQGVLVKFTHAAAVQNEDVLAGIGIFDDSETLRHMPKGLPWMDYCDPAGFATAAGASSITKLPVGLRTHFGETENVVGLTGSRVQTNIEAFPWNHVVVDGRDVPMSETQTAQWLLSVQLPGGESSARHVIGYKFSPDSLYSVLRTISGVLLIAWAGVLVLSSVYGGWQSTGERSDAPEMQE